MRPAHHTRAPRPKGAKVPLPHRGRIANAPRLRRGDRPRPVRRLLCALVVSALAWSPAGCRATAELGRDDTSWPSDRRGLALCYGNDPEHVFALGKDGRPIESYNVSPDGLLSRGMAMLDRDNVMLLRKGSYEAQFVGGSVAAALSRAGAFTIEACITPSAPAGKTTRTIVSLAPMRKPGGAALALVQTGRRLGLALGPARGDRPAVDLCDLQAHATCHVAVTCRPGRLTCYRDGRQVASSTEVGRAFKADGPYRLVFGDTYAGDSDWPGRLEGIAIYARELSAGEVERNHRARLALSAKRPKVPILKIRATLLEQSDPPRPGSNPYYRALAISLYRVDKVIEGTYDGREIVVAHWARWRNTLLPFCKAPIGQRFDLVLVLFDQAGRRVTLDDQSFTLGDKTFDLPWYYDAGLLSLLYEAPRPKPP